MHPKMAEYQQLKARQAATMQQHQQFSQVLQQRQQQNQARQGDLDVASRIMKVLDSRIPKSARQFLNTQLATHMGVDPKNEAFKQTNSMLLGLDPMSAQMLKTQFGQVIQDAEPGQIADMTRGLMTGQLPLDKFIGDIDFTGETMLGGEGDDQLTSGAAGGANTTVKAKTPAQPFAGGPGGVQSFEGQRTIPAASQQASPMLLGALGLDSRMRLRNNDLITNGYRIPLEPKDQEKLAEGIVTRSVGLSSTISEAANMVSLFKGKPETLGPVGSLARGLSGTVQQVQGFLNLVRPGTTVDGADDATRAVARRVGITVMKGHGIDATADNSARIESMVLGLAYRMAVANDIPGNRLTNGIIQQNLAQLGRSSSPAQFEAVLKDTIAATTREFDEHVRRTVGVDGLPLLARQMSDDDILRAARSGSILPGDMATALRNEAARRVQREPVPGITPASPTLDEEERTLGGMEVETKQRKIEQTEQEMRLARERDERAQSAEVRAEQREDRMATAQQRQADIQKESLDFQRSEASIDNARADRAQDRADEREDRLVATSAASQQLAREQFDYKKIQDRQESDQKQSEAMMSMWIQFGKAIAGIGGGGSGGVSVPSMGGGQDAGAFRISNAPERRAPNPGGR